MNEAIRETPILNRRLLGLVQLLEPDYFDGENPDLVLPATPAPTFFVPVTPQPTVAPLTRPPTTPFPTRTELNPDSAALPLSRNLAVVALGTLASLCLLW